MKKFYFLSLALLLGAAVAKAENTAFIGEKGYADLVTAYNAANDNDVIELTAAQTLSARFGVIKSVTIKGRDTSIEIIGDVPSNNQAILCNQNKTIVFENLTFVGKRINKPFVALEKGNITLNNIVVKNCEATSGAGGNNCAINIKNNDPTIKINGIIFDNCTTTTEEDYANIRVGSNNKTTISGNIEGSIYLDKGYSITAADIANTKPIEIKFGEYVNGATAVKNWSTSANFTFADGNYYPAVSGSNLVVWSDGATAPVEIKGNKTIFGTVNEALAAAVEGDEIIVNENQTINSRLNISNKKVTIKGNGDDVKFISAVPANSLTVLVNESSEVTFENITFEGNSTEHTNSMVEVTKAKATFNNCKFMNFTKNVSGVLTFKNGGHGTVKDCAFENCKPVESGLVFCGLDGVNFEGNNSLSVFIESKHYITTANLTNTTPINVILGDTEGRDVVKGCNDPSKFNLLNEGFKLVADGENLKVVESGSTGIEDIIAGDDTNVPAVYYNLQGQRVDNPSNGVFIRKTGSKVEKVIVK